MKNTRSKNKNKAKNISINKYRNRDNIEMEQGENKDIKKQTRDNNILNIRNKERLPIKIFTQNINI